MKIFHKDLAFFSGDHGIGKHHAKRVIIRKFYVGTFKKIILQHIVIAKLKLHASLIGFQKILRRILSRQTEFFDYCYCNDNPRKTLPFNLFFQLKKVFFVDPSLAFHIDADMGLCRIAGYLCDRHHVKKLFQLFVYL